MAYRNLMIASNAQLKIKNEQLLIKTDTTHSVPIEDINSVLVENHQSTITIATLAKLVQDGVTIFVCDEKHTPCAIMMPFAQMPDNTVLLNCRKAYLCLYKNSSGNRL